MPAGNDKNTARFSRTPTKYCDW